MNVTDLDSFYTGVFLGILHSTSVWVLSMVLSYNARKKLKVIVWPK